MSDGAANVEGLVSQGVSLLRSGDMKKAVSILKEACAADPSDASVALLCAKALEASDDIPEAVSMYERTIALEPSNVHARTTLATIYNAGGRLSDVMKVCMDGLRMNPQELSLRMPMAMALTAMGRIPEAHGEFSFIADSCKGYTSACSDILMCLLYSDKSSAEDIFNAHLKWAERYEKPIMGAAPKVEPLEGRRIRIGYLSQDMRRHSVSFFFESALASHNKRRFETFCYSDSAHHDDVSERLKSLSDNWRNVSQLTDEDTAKLILEDKLDILFDLAGHTGRRLRVFAMRPAPLQATWIGYPSTTGLASMDFRISDIKADPPGAESLHTERLLRMPDCFLCYTPPREAPEVSPPPCLSNNFITFGSFNAMAKLSPYCIGLWASALHAVPNSRMLIKNKSLADAEARKRLLDAFAKEGVAEDRLTLLHYIPSAGSHLAAYGMVDVALDSYPYHGTTTTCEALWMGVPTISLTGSPHHARVGLSLMSVIGLSSFACETPEAFTETAKAFASDFNSVASLRASLRPAMASSPLCAAKPFTRTLEAMLLDRLREKIAS